MREIEPALKDKSLPKEISGCRRFISRPALGDLLPSDQVFDKTKRDELLRKANVEYGCSFSELGRHIGLHYATASKIVRKASAKTS